MTRQFKKQFKNQSQTEYMQSNEPQIVSGEEEKKNRIKTRSQSGRSMVEMLGVLAIIAILSIGGIVGYKLAMNYYQADQIANEINLMRNDLKVKYALGNEELLLGDPYDDTPENEHYSGHLSTQYDRYPVDYDCIIRGNKESKNELYNCREADAYYIAVGNISKGVCKPLTTLVAAMDGRLEMDINGLSYTGDDLCSSDEANEIYVEFDAEDVNGNYDSNRPEGWCAKNDDCDASRPICDIANNECVECTEDADCPTNKPICNVEQGNCESCPSTTPKWNGKECVECTTSADCENPKPYCNPTTNTCEPCENDSQCDTTQNEHCKISTGECVVCEDGAEWDEETEECMSCSNRECADNSDCCKDYFCKKGYTAGSRETVHSNETGTCEPLGEVKSISLNGKTLYGSDLPLAWWDGCRWCEARSRKSGSQCDNNTYEPLTMVDVDDINWQCSELPDFKNGTPDQICCKGDGTIERISPNLEALTCDIQNISPVIKKLRAMYLGDENNTSDVYIWFKNYSREEGNNWRIIYANLKFGSISNNGYRYDNQYIDRFRTICK